MIYSIRGNLGEEDEHCILVPHQTVNSPDVIETFNP